MTAKDDERWFRRHVALHFSGLLNEDEEARFRRLAEDNPECWDLLGAVATAPGAVDAGESEHIPSAVIARWAVARQEVRGLERELIQGHLDECESCRQELELLGHAPTLDSTRSGRVLDGDFSGGARSRRTWVLTGSLVAAAVLVVALLSPSLLRDKEGTGGGSSSGLVALAGGPSDAFELLGVSPGPVPAELHPHGNLSRGRSAGRSEEIGLAPDEALRLTGFDYPAPQTPGPLDRRLRLLDPEGRIVVEGTVPATALSQDGIVIAVFRPIAPWVTGTYTLELLDDAGSELRSDRLTIRSINP